MIVPFGAKTDAPLPTEGFVYNGAERKWDFYFDEENLAPLPVKEEKPLSKKVSIFLTALVVVCNLGAVAVGLPLVEESLQDRKPEIGKPHLLSGACRPLPS
ncbi:MAG: hypothetical protein RQ824_11290 [bacterium]|nr:hypothetical protein [bacterium]